MPTVGTFFVLAVFVAVVLPVMTKATPRKTIKALMNAIIRFNLITSKNFLSSGKFKANKKGQTSKLWFALYGTEACCVKTHADFFEYQSEPAQIQTVCQIVSVWTALQSERPALP
ncbi:hypothetical protein LPL03_24910 [Lactiplantibacillus argentoratensis]|nr:hypothetical protein LJA01_26740 [Lactobacillus japonicus]GEO54395.1 hypothetical protein LPL03_24910 [Lactiplantibacillus argentoratensis]